MTMMMVCSRRGRDKETWQAVQEARPGWLGFAERRRVHVAARTAAESASTTRHRDFRHGRQRRSRLQRSVASPTITA